MLKLIDGKELTEEVKEAFKKGITKAYIKLKDGTIIDNNNYLKDIQIEDLRYNEETNNFIGEAIAKRVTLNIYNEENEINLEDKDFEVFIGAQLADKSIAWIKYGNFIVQKPENNDTKESSEIIALDYMVKLNKPYVVGVEFPCTYAELAEDVCRQCDIELGNNTFRNADKTVFSNPFIDNEQCRVVIKQIAKIAFSWARIGIDNKLYIDFMQKNMDSAAEYFTLDDYIELNNNQQTIPVNTIILMNSAIDSENITIYDESLISQYGKQKELIIKEDYFAYNQEIRQNLIEAARDLMGLIYYPISLKSIGTIYLENNDVIEIETKNGKKISTYCFNHIIKYNGTLFDNIDSPAMTETETKYKHESQDDLKRRKTEISIDKANQKIESIVKEIGDRSEKTTTITQDIEGIESEVRAKLDLTRKITGTTEITLEECMEGTLLSLEIQGNNTVFSPLYPNEDLYPGEDLYPLNGDCQLLVINYDDDGNIITKRIENLGYVGPLLQKDNIYDSLKLNKNKLFIIRRIGELEDGTTYILPEPREELLRENVSIRLDSGTNKISIIDYEANLSAEWIIINEFTDTFVSTVELNSVITQIANMINLEVSKKVGNDEIIARINMAVLNRNEAEIPEDIEKSIIEILANKIHIQSDNFELTKEGVITAVAGTIAGLRMTQTTDKNSYLAKNYTNSEGEVYQSGLYIPYQTEGNNTFLYAGCPINGKLTDSNFYVRHDGLTKSKWFSVNGESGYFFVDYDSGKRALDFNKDGIMFKLDNDNNNIFFWQWKGSDGMRYAMYDAPAMIIYDAIHQKNLLSIKRYAPEHGQDKDEIYAELDINIWGTRGDGINNSIYVQGYEVTTNESDERIKKNILDSEIKALELIKRIHHVSFDWDIEKAKKEGHIDCGYIAQELIKIDPNFVIYNKQFDTYQINTLYVLATATKAIQELDKKIEKRDKIIEYLAEKLDCKNEVIEMLKEGD